MKTLIVSLCAAAVATLLAPDAGAMGCSITQSTGISFGSYDVFSSSPVDSTGSITYQCEDVTGADTIVINLSVGSASSYFPRKLLQGAYELSYNLYTSASRITVWGDGSSGTGRYGPVEPAEGVPTVVTIYGRLPALQNARVGSYDDTVVVTVLF